MFNKELFASLLKNAIGDRSINQYAMNCGVSATYISKLLRGLVEKAPGVEIIKKFSQKAYNAVSYENLMIAAGHWQSDLKANELSHSPDTILAPYPTTGDPMDDLPPEALQEIEEFKAFVRHKYKDYYKNKAKGKNAKE